MLFMNQRPTGATLKRSCGYGLGRFSPVKFHAQWCGISALSNVSPRGLKAALISHTNGYRKRIATPMHRRTKIPLETQPTSAGGRYQRGDVETVGSGLV